jgi:hypothetical protein
MRVRIQFATLISRTNRLRVCRPRHSILIDANLPYSCWCTSFNLSGVKRRVDITLVSVHAGLGIQMFTDGLEFWNWYLLVNLEWVARIQVHVTMCNMHSFKGCIRVADGQSTQGLCRSVCVCLVFLLLEKAIVRFSLYFYRTITISLGVFRIRQRKLRWNSEDVGATEQATHGTAGHARPWLFSH